jgi:hypothetical protein
MSKYIFIIGLSLFAFSAFAQDLTKKNDIFLELGGNGFAGSVNFARQLTKKPRLELRAGLGIYPVRPYLTIPVSLNYLIAMGNQHAFLNFGIGATYTKADITFGVKAEYVEGYVYRKSEAVNFVPNFGYRYYTTKDFSWRVNFTPVINRHATFPIFGIGAGKRF